MRRNIVLITIAVLVLGLIIGYIFILPLFITIHYPRNFGSPKPGTSIQNNSTSNNISKTEEWKKYSNKDLNLSFEYPPILGDITFSKVDDRKSNYIFSSSNKSFLVVSYNPVSGNIAALLDGETIVDSKSNYNKNTLKIFLADKTEKDIYKTPDKSDDRKIADAYFSPNGDYLSIDVVMYEGARSVLINIKSGQVTDINGRVYISSNEYGSSNGYAWSPDGKSLAIHTMNGFEDAGNEGVLVSDYGNPEKINNVTSNVASFLGGHLFVKNLKFTSGDKITFSSVYNSGYSSNDASDVFQHNYEYNLTTKKLKEF